MDEIPMTLVLIFIVALIAIALALIIYGTLDDKTKYWGNATQNEQSKAMHEIAGYNSHYCIKTIGDLCIGI